MTEPAGGAGTPPEPSNRPPPGISACFPAFNDAASIGWVARRAREALLAAGGEFEILILDDGSRDETPAALASLEPEIPELRLLRHPENRGYGATLRDLFTAARLPLVFYTDGDGQFDPAELARLLAVRRPETALVNGYRTERAFPPLRRRLGPRFHRVVAATFDLPPLRDWDCDFRLFRRDAVPPETMTFADGTAVVEFLAAFARSGLSFAEAEVTHRERLGGESQYYRPGPVFEGHRNLLRLRRRFGSPPIRWSAWLRG